VIGRPPRLKGRKLARFIEITLEKRGVSCTARLLDEQAPNTARAVWDALPQRGDALHAKYARNEIYALVPAFADVEPGRENTTITPIPGDVAYFMFDQWQLNTPGHGYVDGQASLDRPEIVDLALFYERNNLLLNPDYGWVPANIFATITEGLDRMAAAATDMWLKGVENEVLSFSRLPEQ